MLILFLIKYGGEDMSKTGGISITNSCNKNLFASIGEETVNLQKMNENEYFFYYFLSGRLVLKGVFSNGSITCSECYVESEKYSIKCENYINTLKEVMDSSIINFAKCENDVFSYMTENGIFMGSMDRVEELDLEESDTQIIKKICEL